MAQKYLDESGLAYFWQKVKAYGNSHWGGSASGTSVPTADTVAEFDSTAHMNSTDMTSQEVSDFVDSLDVSGISLSDLLTVVHTQVSVSGTLTAHTGGGVTVNVAVPSGYKILTHLSAWNTGSIGVVASFDAYASTSATVNLYQNNTTNGTASRGVVHLTTLCIKDL